MGEQEGLEPAGGIVFGLTIDAGVIGYAAIDLAAHEIIEVGTRRFPSSRNPKTKVSLASERRAARSARRNIDRTRKRKRAVMRLLKQEGLVVPDAPADHFKSRPVPRLRAEGLDRLLTEEEWASVLYTLAGRRGYIPHGETGDREEGKVLRALKANAVLEHGGVPCRTVGEWLWLSAPERGGRTRNLNGDYTLCVTHTQLADEVRTLFERQRELDNAHASDAFLTRFMKVFDSERGSERADELSYERVGSCLYFPERKRAARSTLTSELVAAYGQLGNIRVTDATRGESRTLTNAERSFAIDALFPAEPLRSDSADKFTYKRLRSLLGLASSCSFNTCPTTDESRPVYDPKGWRAIRRALAGAPDVIAAMREDVDLADQVIEDAVYSSTADVFADRLRAHGVPAYMASALADALPLRSSALNGYGTRSKDALDMLLSCFTGGCSTLTEAEEASGLLALRSQGTAIERSRLLPPYAAYAETAGLDTSNPVVMRALAQARKVVNALICRHGVPDSVHVSLVRTLNASPEELSRMRLGIERAKRDAARRRAEIEALGVPADSIGANLLEKYRLWEEQLGRDAYTDESIPVDRLVTEEHAYEVGHILPLSRSGDDHRANRVLTSVEVNRRKCVRSPCEWMRSGEPDAPDWAVFCARVAANKAIPASKRWRLLTSDFSVREIELFESNVADRSYMASALAAYIGDTLDFPQGGGAERVLTLSMDVVPLVRRAWSLGYRPLPDGRPCPRAALDAALIAASDLRAAHRAAAAAARPHDSGATHRMLGRELMPWPAFAADLDAALARAGSSTFSPRKASGCAIKATRYSIQEIEPSGKIIPRGGTEVMGNNFLLPDGKSFQRIGGVVCLRLWHDPDGRPGGRWLAEPVYIADLPAARRARARGEEPSHHFFKAKTDRSRWPEVPADVVALHDIVEIHYGKNFGDIIEVAGRRGRVTDFNSASGCWQVEPLDGIKGFPSITRGLDSTRRPKVVRDGV